MAVENESQRPAGTGRSRSPNFPALSLPDAIKKTKVIYDADGRTPTSGKVIMNHLGYGEKISGSAGRVLSALRQYGLLQDAAGDKYRVSDAAFHILTLSDDSAIRKTAIESAARKPAIFNELLKEYPDRLPSNSTLRDTLIADKKFNPVSVDSFIRAFRGTIEFAKLYDTPYSKPSRETSPIAVGDYVQWTSQGVDQFAVPRKVWMIPDSGDFVMVEGSPTGIPMEQVTKADPPTPHIQGAHIPSTAQLFPPTGAPAKTPTAIAISVAREVSSLPEGEAMLQWPSNLSPESVEDLEAWLELVIRKMKRRYANPTKAQDAETQER
jgi:hypothetical protein